MTVLILLQCWPRALRRDIAAKWRASGSFKGATLGFAVPVCLVFPSHSN